MTYSPDTSIISCAATSSMPGTILLPIRSYPGPTVLPTPLSVGALIRSASVMAERVRERACPASQAMKVLARPLTHAAAALLGASFLRARSLLHSRRPSTQPTNLHVGNRYTSILPQ